MTSASRNLSFFPGLALRLGERGITAIGVFLNSILIARTLSDQDAAAYFVIVSVCQLVISPWVAGADYVWIRYRAAGASPEKATDKVFAPVLWGSLFASLVAIVACALLLSGAPEFGLLLTCVVGNLVFSVITLHLPSKFGQPAIYLFVSVVGGSLAVAFKMAVLILAPGESWSYAALFGECYLIAALALLMRPRVPTSGQSGAMREFLLAFAGTAFLVVSTIVSLRLVLLVASRVLEQSDYVTFGLAFQVMNAVSVFGAAVSNSIVASSLAATASGTSIQSITRRGFVGAVALFLAFAGFLYAVGEPVLTYLLRSRGSEVHLLVISGLCYSASVLVHAICNAVASLTDSTRAYSWALIGATLISATVLAVAPIDGLNGRIALWGLTTLLSSLLISAWLIGRSRSWTMERDSGTSTHPI